MSSTEPYNLLIAGVGGQGIYTLSQVFWGLCERRGFACQGAVYKGGAQKMGSVHAVLRMFFAENPDYSDYSPEIPAGQLDLMIGLEPWETLRHRARFGARTLVLACRKEYPLFFAGRKAENGGDPEAILRSLQLPRGLVAEDFGGAKMVNYAIGRRAVERGDLPFTCEEYDQVFQAVRARRKSGE